MKCVEFNTNPPTFEICNTADGMCVIRFYCDVQETTRENEGVEETAYKTTCYELKSNRSANLQARVENSYNTWLQMAKEKDGGIDAIKKEKVNKSKEALAVYLASHPITSSAHDSTPGVYSVTEAKQTLMMGQYISYQAEKTVNPSAVLTWNESGKSCEIWTEGEFMQLMVEVKQYVYPLVSRQQTIEEEINAAKTIDEIEAVVISYESI